MLPVRGEGESRERDGEKQGAASVAQAQEQEAPLCNGERGLDNWGIMVSLCGSVAMGHA